MASLAGYNIGQVPFQMNGEPPVALKMGTPANAAALAGAVQIVLPVDPNSKAYKAYQIQVSGAVWINFNSDSTAPTIAGANCYLVQANAPLIVVPPLTATQIGATPATGVTTPDVCVIGLF